MLGPIFYREAAVTPKRPKTFVARGLYVLSLFALLCTGYLVLDGSRSLATSGDAARFGWLDVYFTRAFATSGAFESGSSRCSGQCCAGKRS